MQPATKSSAMRRVDASPWDAAQTSEQARGWARQQPGGQCGIRGSKAPDNEAPTNKAPTLQQAPVTGPLLPGPPFQGLPDEVATRVLLRQPAPDLIPLRQVSQASRAFMDRYLAHDRTPEQARQTRQARHCHEQRQLAASANLFASTWRTAAGQPTPQRLAACRKMARRSPYLRLPLRPENRAHWKTMVELASAGAWKILELDVLCSSDDAHLTDLQVLASCIAEPGGPGSELVLHLQLEKFGGRQARGLALLLEQCPHIGALCLEAGNYCTSALDSLAGLLAKSSLRVFRCSGELMGGEKNSLYEVLSAPRLEIFELLGMEPCVTQVHGWTEALGRSSGLTHFRPDTALDLPSFAAVMAALGQHAQLSCLDLAGCQLEPDAAVQVAQLLGGDRKLETLKLNAYGMGNAGLAALASSLKTDTTLRCLVLCGINTSSRGARACGEGMCDLYRALATNRTLQSLSVCPGLPAAGVEPALVTMLVENTTLEELELDCDSPYGEDDSETGSDDSVSGAHLAQPSPAIMAALAAHGGLKKLVLRNGNQAALESLFSMLRTNVTLNCLELDDFIEGEDGVAGLAQALEGNQTLTELMLAGSVLYPSADRDHPGTSGFGGLCALIQGPNALRRLRLINCPIRGNPEQLAAALGHNTQLRVLELRNSMSADTLAMPRLLDAILRIPTLSVLLLDETFMPDAALECLATALQQRSTPLFLWLDMEYISIDPECRRPAMSDEDGSSEEMLHSRRSDLRQALLDVVANNPQIVIPGLVSTSGISSRIDWRDFERK